jgi:hypothetical protein
MSAIGIGSDHRARVVWEALDGQREADGAKHDEVAELTAVVAQLRNGMATRQLIGTATGLVAARFGCTTEQSWALLARVSQHTNIKLREIARVMVDAHNGASKPEDAAILGRVSSQLPGGWPRIPSSPA